jgi:hypothetical protein
MTYAVRPPGRAAYVRLGVVLLLGLSGLIGVGAAASWAGPAAAGSTPERLVSSGEVAGLGISGQQAPGARTVPTTTPSRSDTSLTSGDGAAQSGSTKLAVYGLALLTGLLAIVALTRRGRPPRGRGPQQ